MLHMRLAILLAVPVLFPSWARAYSDDVRMQCRADYLEHCSQHQVGSAGLSACMRNVGPNLRPACIGALLKSGEASGSKTTPSQAADAGASAKAIKGDQPAENTKQPLKAKPLKVKQSAKAVPLKQVPGANQGNKVKLAKAGQAETLKQAAASKQGKKVKQVATAGQTGPLKQVTNPKQVTPSNQVTASKQGKKTQQVIKASLTGPNKQAAIPKQGVKKVKQVANASPVQQTLTSKQALELKTAGSKKTNQAKQTAKADQAKAGQTKTTLAKPVKLATTGSKQPQKLKQVVKANGAALKQNAKLKKAAVLKPGNKASTESAANN